MSDANESAGQPAQQPKADPAPPQRPVEPEITLVLGRDYSKDIPNRVQRPESNDE